MPSPLSRQGRWSLFARPSPSSAAFPVIKSGRLLQLLFRDLLSVHSRYGLHARGVASRPFPSKAPTASLPPLPLRLLLCEGRKSQGRRGGPPYLFPSSRRFSNGWRAVQGVAVRERSS